jgi:hypothetical protein
LWVPHDEFFERFRARVVLDNRRFPFSTVWWLGVRPLYSDFGCENIRRAVQLHSDAQIWTEHEGEGDELFYTEGVGLVNRTGAFILVRKNHRNRFFGWLERLARRACRRGIAIR